jgi:hypothetical protein
MTSTSYYSTPEMQAGTRVITKFPPGYFGLYDQLSPIIGWIAEIRYDYGFPASIVKPLACTNGVLVDLVTDDELGLIGASPEERVRLALAMRESGYV